MKTLFLILVALLFASSPALAQSAPYTHILKVYNVGASAPFQTTTAPATAATCNLAPSPASSGDVVNATIVEYDDPNAPGKVCRLSLTSFFGGMPVGQRQVARLVLRDEAADLESEESVDSNPFVRRAAPPAAAHLRIVRGGGQ